MEKSEEKYFGFMDEGGNSTQEKFFGLGFLMMKRDEIGRIFDAIKPYYEKIFQIAENNKRNRISLLKEQDNIEEIYQIAKSSKRFELKFNYINFTNNSIYKNLIEEYFKFPGTRFCALIMERSDKDGDGFSHWASYIHNASMLISNNIKHISPGEICILVDDLSRPKTEEGSFEESLTIAINKRLRVNHNILSSSLFGVSRIESHSSLMVQLVDILLGAVMFDFKNNLGLVSEKLHQRQFPVVEKMREILKTNSFAKNQTYDNPNYFSVWEFKRK